ncbi:HlyD family efflux transporter periplasmic adaptor subunit [Candidatus Parcubacteria bacterium]|nr:HlyD family efflux transporter periplasmic adaptor subunit [Candidatus Parcubacteria bacterium]
MNKAAVKSLIKGLIILALISATTFIFLDARSGVKVSQNSKISAEEYVVGSDYSGLITKQLVKKGDFIEKDRELLYIKSSKLLEDINAKRVNKKDLLYPISGDQQIIIKASQSGKVSEINYAEGSFVPANNDIMKITAAQDPFVIAEYQLSKNDFELLNEQTKMQVELPNGSVVTSPIDTISIQQASDLQINSKFNVTIKSDIEPDNNLLIGSPVTTRLFLNQDTQLQKMVNFF